MEFDVVVEVPRGSRNKYEIDHESGVIRLDRQLFTATRYPADYGFIDGTLGEDGDPRALWRELDDVPAHLRNEIRHFFEIYKDLEPGKSSEVFRWEDRRAAEREVTAGQERAAGAHGASRT